MIFCFLLPNTGNIPQGGYKVVYEYGNRFAKDGHIVYYVYGIISRKDLTFPISFAYKFCRLFRYLKYLFVSYKPEKWFYTHNGSKHILALSLNEKYIPKADYVIATSWATAYWLNDYKSCHIKKKFYFIQGFEDWSGYRNKVIYTWKLPLEKIVISDWLKDYAHELNEKAHVVYNGFNLNDFYLEQSIESRNPNEIIMMWHISKSKCASMGISILQRLKKENSSLKVTIFGATPKPSNLPIWMEYYQSPNINLLRKLYNRSSIYIGTSSNEGWGLTVGEAMLCGCAVACTNNKGFQIMAKHLDTALLSNIYDEKALYLNIKRLMLDKTLRCQLAYNGMNYVKNFNWDTSYEKLKIIFNI